MAETFNSYYKTAISTNSASENIIIPNAISGQNSLSGTGVGSRKINSVAQVHSILISHSYTYADTRTVHLKSFADDPTQPVAESNQTEAQAVFFNMFIKDGTTKCYLIVDGMIPYQNSFYLEKTITLLPSQSLGIEFISNAGVNSKNHQVCAFSSSAEIS